MKNPKVSIITPSYNQGHFIEETIQSVVSQSYNNIEYIIIDGDSNDKTKDIIRNHSKQISLFISERDSGQSDAINKGLNLCNGSIIMWLNSDDILFPDSVSEAVRQFERDPGIDILHGHSILFGSNFKESTIGQQTGDWTALYPAYMPFPQPSSFFSRRLISNTGPLDTHLHYGMDFDLLVRAYLTGQVKYHPYLFSKYRLHDNSKTNHQLRFVTDWQEVFSRFLNSISTSSKLPQLLITNQLHTGTRASYRAVNKFFSEKHLKLIIANHLNKIAHISYQAGDKDLSMKCVYFMKVHLTEYYYSFRLDDLRMRLQYLPHWLAMFLRGL